MSKKKQKEIIELLEATLRDESLKVNGGNSDIIESLTKRLEKVKTWEKKKDE
jgi:16S rRNA G1207 methylase RsmC